MKKTAAILAIAVASGCSVEPRVLEDDGKTVVLMGGPAVSTTLGQQVAHLQPEADRRCQASGSKRAQFAGESVDVFVSSLAYTCVD